MEKGIVQQYAVPQNMYLNPDNKFVAQFLGMPQINTFGVEVKNGAILCKDVVLREGCNIADGTYTAGVRPEAFEVCEGGMQVTADAIRMTGRDLLIHFTLGGEDMRVLVHSDMQIEEGNSFALKVRPGQIMVFGNDGTTIGKF